MNKEFVTYGQAIALKELGFDEPCFGYYNKNNSLVRFPSLLPNAEICNSYFLDLNENSISTAPLYQQAFRWFREKYNITQTIARDGSLAKEGHWAYTIVYDGIYFNDGYLTYEEAEQACLDKLIEIVKEI